MIQVVQDFAGGRKSGNNIPGCWKSMSRGVEAGKDRHVCGPADSFQVSGTQEVWREKSWRLSLETLKPD